MLRFACSPNGDRYEGEYRDGVRHGKGTLTKLDGTYEVREYRGGRRSGGSYRDPDEPVDFF